MHEWNLHQLFKSNDLFLKIFVCMIIINLEGNTLLSASYFISMDTKCSPGLYLFIKYSITLRGFLL